MLKFLLAAKDVKTTENTSFVINHKSSIQLRLYRSVYSNYEFIHYSHTILLYEISILDTFIFNSIFIRAVDILFTNKTLELFCEIVHESSFRA